MNFLKKLMDLGYKRVFNFNREPFSSSPDPDFLYQSRQHFGTLQLLENSIRTGNQVNLIIGAPGTGKTTLCRYLLRKMANEKCILIYQLNSRFCDSIEKFEEDVVRAFEIPDLMGSGGIKAYERIFSHLYDKVVNNKQAISLVIDDGHMIPESCFGFLDKIAGLEVDGKRLVQLVIFANPEFLDNLKGNSGLEDKVTAKRDLAPLNFNDTRHMIEHRLKIASNSIEKNRLFSFPAMLAIYIATSGYPKKIVKLCNRLIHSMKERKTNKAGWLLVRSNIRYVLTQRRFFPDFAITVLLFVLPISLIVVIATLISLNMVNKSSEPVLNESFRHLPETEEVSDKDQAPDTVNENIRKKPPKIIEKAPPVVESLPEKSIPSAFKMPEIIGTVIVKRGDTLLVMLEKVYGHSQKRYRIPLLEANMHIENINNLKVGDIIKFPPLDAELKVKNGPGYWVKIVEKEKLNEAYDYLRTWPLYAEKIKIISYFSNTKGLKFTIVLKKKFSTKKEAEDSIKSLPEGTADKSEVIQFTFKETRYFADPHFN